MRFDPSIFNMDPVANTPEPAPSIGEFRGLEMAQGISPLTFGLAQAVAKGSQFKIASQDLLGVAASGVYPEERLAELETANAQLQRRMQPQGFQAQDLSLMASVPPSAQLSGQLPAPGANGQQTPAMGTSQDRAGLTAELERLQQARQNLQLQGLDTSRLDNAIAGFQDAMMKQPEAPAMVRPQLEDWQKVALGIAALFGGGDTLNAVAQGIQQGVITRADIENQANQQDFANRFNTWRQQVGGLGDLVQSETQRVNQADRNRINEFNAEDRRLAQSVDDIQRQIENMDRNEREAARNQIRATQIDAQAAIGLRRIATQEQTALLNAAKTAPPEVRGTLYAQLRSISDPNSVFGMMTDEQLNAIASAETPEDVKVDRTKVQIERDKAAAKRIATQIKVDEARATQIVEATKWIRPDMQSRIQDRIARIEVARRNSQLAAQRLQLANDKFAQGANPKTAKGANDANKSVINALKEEAKNLEELRKSYKFVMDNEASTDSPAYKKAQASAAAMTAEIEKIRERITNANKAVYDVQNATIPPFEFTPGNVGGLSGAIGPKPATNVPKPATTNPKPKPKPNTSKGKTQKTKSGTEFVIE